MRIPILGLATALAVGLAIPIWPAWASPPSDTSLTTLIAQALATNPRLKAAEARAAAAQGDVMQAGVLPNPQVSLQTENLAGSGPYRGTRAMETTIGLNQLVELGGKRGSRQAVATAAGNRARLDADIVRLDLVRDVRVAHAALLAATARRAIVEEQRGLAAETARAVAARVRSGHDSAIQEDRAATDLRQAEIEAARAVRDETAARRSLELLVGCPVPPLDPAALSDLGAALPVAAGGNTPDVARWRAEVGRTRAAIAVERARAVPDVTVGAGVRRFNDGRDTALVLGVTIPIPAFDTNRGGIHRAYQESTEAEMELDRATRDQDTALAIARDRVAVARTEAETLAGQVVPGAEQAAAATREGYRQGKFPYLDVLDAQRTLLATRLTLVAAYQDYHQSRADLDRLTGAEEAQP
ncbi:cobalt-zinc-cadmium efflux system outer membrane protein [Nitrospirillum viridazoti]|uniref:TolC family protein n=1 Tax=Nitrospirillum viridazoti TaxID=3144925 RepID=UPI0011A4D4C0|nr:TolC family protein [Nitrospirillum amazonense]TWB35345.1 cobalt-zinc-cadmium efflux system outer membrane protein [Nitrospirillum amazonense]